MNSIQFPFSNHTRKNYLDEYVIFIRFNQLEIERGWRPYQPCLRQSPNHPITSPCLIPEVHGYILSIQLILSEK